MRGRTVWLGCSILLISTAGCAADPGAGAGEQVATPAVGSPDGEAKPSSRREAGPRKPGGQRPKGERSTVLGPAPTPKGGQPAPSARSGPPGGLASGASGSRSDPSGDPDRSGDAPAYADIRRATLRGTPRTLTLTLRVDGEIPKALPEGADMTMNFRLDLRGDNDHQIYAIGGRDGWRADLDNSASFPGRFSIAGDSFAFELPWRRLGGRATFRWEAETAWTYTPSGPLAETEFAFDRVPEYEAARYPE